MLSKTIFNAAKDAFWRSYICDVESNLIFRVHKANSQDPIVHTGSFLALGGMRMARHSPHFDLNITSFNTDFSKAEVVSELKQTLVRFLSGMIHMVSVRFSIQVILKRWRFIVTELLTGAVKEAEEVLGRNVKVDDIEVWHVKTRYLGNRMMHVENLDIV